MKLYELIQKLEQPEEEFIRKKLKSLSPAQYHSAKKYLYQELLHYWNENPKNPSFEMQVMKAYAEVESLLALDCFEAAEKRYKEMVQFVNTTESVHLLPLLGTLGYKISERLWNADFHRFQLEELEQRDQDLKDWIDYCQLALKSRQVILGGSSNTYEWRRGQYAEIAKHKLYKRNLDQLPLQTAQYWFKVRALVSSGHQDYHDLVESSERFIARLKETKDCSGILLNHIGLAWVGYFNGLTQIDPEKFLSLHQESLSDLKQVVGNRWAEMEARFYPYYLHMTFVAYWTSGRMEEAIAFGDEYERYLKEHWDSFKAKDCVNHGLAMINTKFLKGDMKAAQEWYFNFRNKWQDIPSEHMTFFEIMNVLISYELGQTSLTESAIRNAYRKFKRDALLGETEKRLLKLWKRPPNPHDKEEQLKVWKELRKDLLALFKLPSEKHTLGYFDYISFIDTKIKGISFLEAVKQNLELNKKIRAE